MSVLWWRVRKGAGRWTVTLAWLRSAWNSGQPTMLIAGRLERTRFTSPAPLSYPQQARHARHGRRGGGGLDLFSET